MKKLLTIALILTATLCVQAKKYKLALNLEQGKEYSQKTIANMVVIQDFNGMQIEINLTVKGTMLYKIASASDSEYNMDVQYKNMTLEMNTPQGKTSFSSENVQEGDLMSSMLSKLIGKPFQIIMTKTGKVNEVNGIDKVFEGMFEGIELDPQSKEQILAQVRQSYGEKAIIGSLEQVTAIYPEEKVKLGKTWSIETNIEAGMSVDLITNFELKGANNSYYLIHGKGIMASNPDSPYVNQNGMDMKIILDGQLSSDIKVDRKTGWIIEATITQNLSGNAHLKGNDQLPDGMDIPMTIKSESTITR